MQCSRTFISYLLFFLQMAHQESDILQDIISNVPENLQAEVKHHLQQSLNQSFDEETEVSKGERYTLTQIYKLSGPKVSILC